MNDMANNILEATHVTKRFGGLVAVNDLSFNIPANSIVSIIGPNGAGKTTFFNCVTGIYTPTKGDILIHPKGKPTRRIKRAGKRPRAMRPPPRSNSLQPR